MGKMKQLRQLLASLEITLGAQSARLDELEQLVSELQNQIGDASAIEAIREVERVQRAMSEGIVNILSYDGRGAANER